MMGRSHMAMGAVGAVLTAPILLRTPEQPLFRWMLVAHATPSIAWFFGYLVACLFGSLLPDLDEFHSLASRKLEQVVVFTTLLGAAGLVFLLHLASLWVAWAGVLAVTLASRTAHNGSRRIGLGLLSLGIGYLAFRHVVPILAAAGLVLWCVGAMWSKHRTFTHSLLAVALLATAALASPMPAAWASLHWPLLSIGVLLGYLLHLLADAVAGGVPLLWPWPKRLGVRLVQTGSWQDRGIGLIAFASFLCMLVF